MTQLGIDTQSGFGMPPAQFIELTAALGCSHVTLGLTPAPWNPCQWPAWSLRDDARLRRQITALLGNLGIVLAQGEGFAVRAECDVREKTADLDLMAMLGARSIGTVCLDPDLGRGTAQLALLAELTAERGLNLNLEFAPPHPIHDLAAARAVVAAVDAANLRLTIDAMHHFRSGGTPAQLAALPAALIGHVQLCDAPIKAPHSDYMREACFERLAPGDGELPLRELLTALPASTPIGLEIPMLAAARSDRLLEALGTAVSAARALISLSTGEETALGARE